LANEGGRSRGRPRRLPDKAGVGGPDHADPFIVQAFWKGLQVLNLFDGDHPEWAVVEMASETGIPKATVYRLARTMEAADYLVLDSQTGRYHVGPSAVAFTYLARSYSELARIARPYLETLAAETGETVNLAVEIDSKAVLVDEIRTLRPFKSEVPVGRIIGDIANSNGKVFAAFKPEIIREKIASAPHRPLTQHTVVDREPLLEEFERVRQSGVAYDLEERSLGVCAVGAPVMNQAGSVEAAISLVVPTGRFGPHVRDQYADAVLRTAASLSAFLGYSSPEH
jgi:IclR family KDG regulon transcriptional repressor